MADTIVIPVQNENGRTVKNMPVEIILEEDEDSKEVVAKSIFDYIKILIGAE